MAEEQTNYTGDEEGGYLPISISPRYAVKIIIYDANGNITDRKEELFRKRKLAEDYARERKKYFEENKIYSTVVVVNLQTKRKIYDIKTRDLKKKLKGE